MLRKALGMRGEPAVEFYSRQGPSETGAEIYAAFMAVFPLPNKTFGTG